MGRAFRQKLAGTVAENWWRTEMRWNEAEEEEEEEKKEEKEEEEKENEQEQREAKKKEEDDSGMESGDDLLERSAKVSDDSLRLNGSPAPQGPTTTDSK